MNKWISFVLGFSVAVNLTVLGTVIFLWKNPPARDLKQAERPVLLHRPDEMQDDRLIFINKMPGEPEKVYHKRVDYQRNLERVQEDIDGEREKIVVLLLQEPPNEKTIHVVVEDLADKQIEAEVLTIDHLLDIKPMLPPKKWTDIVHRLHAGHEEIVNVEHEIQIKEFNWTSEDDSGEIKRKIVIQKHDNKHQ
jgi:hypothetical protein